MKKTLPSSDEEDSSEEEVVTDKKLPVNQFVTQNLTEKGLNEFKRMLDKLTTRRYIILLNLDIRLNKL
jgi:hypothetical protein